MNILIDALLVAILVFTAAASYRRGFVKTAVKFLKNIVALIVAGIYSTKLGEYLYEKFFKGVFESHALEKFADWLGVDSIQNLDISALIEAEHSEFVRFVESLGFSSEKLSEFGDNTAEAVAEYISKPLGMSVSKVTAFVLLFILTSLVISIIGFIIGKIVKLPILKTTNKILGLLLGIVLGVIFVFITVSVLDLVLPFVKVGGEALGSADFRESTIVYSYLSERSPLGLIGDLILK